MAKDNTQYHSSQRIRTDGSTVDGSPAVGSTENGITDTGKSKYAVVSSTPLSAVRWTGGFWGERFGVFSGTSVQSMWETWKSDTGHGWNNFLIAAGEKRESATDHHSTTVTCINGLRH